MTPELAQMLWEKGGTAGIGILILFKIGEWIVGYFRAKEKTTDDSIKALMDSLSLTRVEIKKLKLDLRRCFYALKKVSGDAWPKIAEELKQFEEN